MIRLWFISLFCLVAAFGKEEIKVGSKAFTESTILGEIATQLAERSDLNAHHRAELGGSQIVWKALQRGDIDVYAEYTGTLSQELLGGKVANNISRLRLALEPLGLRTTLPLGFNNTYAIGMKRGLANRLNIRTIGDLRAHDMLAFGFSAEFMDRQDAWPVVKETYGVNPGNLRAMEHELAYRALAAGSIDVTDLYSTDAEIPYYDLVLLQDDKHVFPEYQAIYLYRQDLEQRAPEYVAKLQALAGRMSDSAMVELNAGVKLKKRTEAQMAAEYLDKTTKGKATKARADWWQIFKNDLRNHLYLVSISLSLTILFGIPLGIWCAIKPRFGEVVLLVAGIIQTIPSLALLVFMIPLVGIGSKPALIALFLYGLLPILRNTVTGLKDIPRNLLESANALGLPRWYRLWKIELPMASRSILAGVKTAAVINVGTATLGALIGAGGFGESILIGIRRDDTWMILQGAIPAAALAVVVQILFEIAERRLIPRGLRLR